MFVMLNVSEFVQNETKLVAALLLFLHIKYGVYGNQPCEVNTAASVLILSTFVSVAVVLRLLICSTGQKSPTSLFCYIFEFEVLD